MLVHVHERHLKNKSKRVERIHIPVVTDLQHVVLEIDVVVRIGVILQCRRLARRLKIYIVLREDLRELTESIGFLSAVIEHEREHFLVQPAFDIPEIHSSITGRKHSVQTFHHIPFGLDIDDSALTRSVVFGRRIRDNFDLLYRVSVCSVQHGFELLTAEVRRLAIHINLHRFTVYGNISVLVNPHTGRTTENIISVRTGSQRRSRDVHHQLVHLPLNKRFLGFHLHLFEPFGLFLQHKIRSTERRLVTDIRSLNN